VVRDIDPETLQLLQQYEDQRVEDQELILEWQNKALEPDVRKFMDSMKGVLRNYQDVSSSFTPSLKSQLERDVNAQKVWADKSVKGLSEMMQRCQEQVAKTVFPCLSEAQKILRECGRVGSAIDVWGDLLQQLNLVTDKMGDCMAANDHVGVTTAARSMRLLHSQMSSQNLHLGNCLTTLDKSIGAMIKRTEDRTKLYKQFRAELEGKMKKITEKEERAREKADIAAKDALWWQGWRDSLTSLAIAVCTGAYIAGFVVLCIVDPPFVVALVMMMGLEIVCLTALMPVLAAIDTGVRKFWNKHMARKVAADVEVAVVADVMELHETQLKEILDKVKESDQSKQSLVQMQSMVKQLIETHESNGVLLEDIMTRIVLLEQSTADEGYDLQALGGAHFTAIKAHVKQMHTKQADLDAQSKLLTSLASEMTRGHRFEAVEVAQLSEVGCASVDWQRVVQIRQFLDESPVQELKDVLEDLKLQIFDEMKQQALECGEATPSLSDVSKAIAQLIAESGLGYAKSFTAEAPPVYKAVAKQLHNSPSRTKVLSAQDKKSLAYIQGLHNHPTGLSSLPTLPSATGYRGIAHKFSSRKNGVICYYENKSASVIRDVALGFAGNEGTIINMKLINVPDISDVSFYPNEAEVVIPVLSFFKVEKHITRPDGPDEIFLSQMTVAEITQMKSNGTK